MVNAGSAVGADLSGVFGTGKERLGGTMGALEFGEMFGDEFGMVKATGTDVVVNGGEGNDD